MTTSDPPRFEAKPNDVDSPSAYRYDKAHIVWDHQTDRVLAYTRRRDDADTVAAVLNYVLAAPRLEN